MLMNVPPLDKASPIFIFVFIFAETHFQTNKQKSFSGVVTMNPLKSERSRQWASLDAVTVSCVTKCWVCSPVHTLSSPCIAEGGLTVVLECYTVRDKLCVCVCVCVCVSVRARFSVCDLSVPRETINSSRSQRAT